MQTKTKSVQWVLSVLLCLAMVLCMAKPVSAAQVQHTGCYVGGVEITSENAEDVLSDITFENAGVVLTDVKMSYNMMTKTLTIRNVALTNDYDIDECCVGGIYSKDDLTICLEGENSVTALSGKANSFGIFVEGDLTIEGSGSLTVQGSDVAWTVSAEDEDESESAGICVLGDLTISGATVTAKGGNVTVTAAEGWTDDTYAYSEGLWIGGNLYVKDGATVDSFGGDTSAVVAYSDSIVFKGEEIRIENAVVNAIGGESLGVQGSAKNLSYASNRGISGACDLYVSEDSVLKVIAGKAVGGTAHSYGIGITPKESDQYKVVIDGTVVAQGGETIAEEDAFSLGIFVTCGLEVGENAYLEATSSKAQGNTYADSEGLLQYDEGMTIHGGKVVATGAEASYGTDPGASAYSYGLQTEGELVIEQGGSLTATGDHAQGNYARSKGVEADGGSISVYDGSLTATAVKAEGNGSAASYGVYIRDGGFYVYDDAAIVTVISGDAEGAERSYSNPIYVKGGDVGIEAGSVTLVGGSRNDALLEGDAYAIYVQGTTDEDGVVMGGYLWINNTTSGLFGLGGTKLTVTSSEGVAYVSEGILLGEGVTLVPEDAEVAIIKGTDVDGAAGAWGFVDAEGETVKSITVEGTSPCKTRWNNFCQKIQSWF